jgi:purine-binding chemotaxis protein CheW
MDAKPTPGRAPQAGAAAGPRTRQYLTFQVTGELFAMEISSIKEIVEFRDPTEVPLMPDFLRGVINLRGRVVPVIDLAARFGRPRTTTSRRSCIVILEVRHQLGQHDIGVVVDAVQAVLEIPDADVEPAPSFGTNLRADFISGMGKVGERLAIVLEVSKVLSLDELSSLGGIDPSAAAAPEESA